MKRAAVAAFMLFAGVAGMPAVAAPGDVYVPAHRTGNGLWVPANVPPSSGGTRMAKKLTARPTRPAAATSPTVPPLFVAAQPIRR